MDVDESLELRFLEADYAAQILMGVSKELVFKLEASIQLANTLEARLMDDRGKLNLALSENTFFRDKIEKLLKDFDLQQSQSVEDLKDQISKAESRAETEFNRFENRVKEYDTRILLALASAEANKENQNMLNSTVHDMENLIEDLKSKASKYESQAESAEDKCIILSENNAQLKEELCFLRNRIECLEASGHQAEDTKTKTAREIVIRTKGIANLVMQLAAERERLHNQISLLAKKNKILSGKLQQTYQDDSGGNITGITEQVSEASPTNSEVKDGEKVTVGEVGAEAIKPGIEVETVRRIDAGMLSVKCVFVAAVIILISAAAYKIKF